MQVSCVPGRSIFFFPLRIPTSSSLIPTPLLISDYLSRNTMRPFSNSTGAVALAMLLYLLPLVASQATPTTTVANTSAGTQTAYTMAITQAPFKTSAPTDVVRWRTIITGAAAGKSTWSGGIGLVLMLFCVMYFMIPLAVSLVTDIPTTTLSNAQASSIPETTAVGEDTSDPVELPTLTTDMGETAVNRGFSRPTTTQWYCDSRGCVIQHDPHLKSDAGIELPKTLWALTVLCMVGIVALLLSTGFNI